MPEGDTLARLAASLQPLVGARLTACDLRWPSLATADLTGMTLAEVRSAGKFLLMRFAAAPPADDHRGLILLTHLRMEGRWTAHPGLSGAERLRGHRVRAVLEFDDDARTRLIGTSLGEMRLLPEAALPQAIGHLGPDPLDGRVPFDEAEACRRLLTRAGDGTDAFIGTALLDQRRIAGVGNVIRAEVLFLAKISPWDSLEDVAAVPGAAERIVALSRDVLRINAGRRRRTTPVGWASPLWVYGREGKPCLVCGTAILRAQMRGAVERVLYWCPSCQTENVTAPPVTASR